MSKLFFYTSKTVYFAFMKVEIKDSRQEKIILSAENIFFEKGFAKTTILDICKAANCSRTTLYSHFENKENIYLAVINKSFKQFQKYFANLNAEGQNGLERFLNYSKGYVEYSKQFPNNYAIIIDFYTILRSITNEDLQSDSALLLSKCSFFPEVKKNAENPSNYLVNVIKEGQEDGSINREIKANILFLNVWAYLIGTSSVFNFSSSNGNIYILGLNIKHPEKNMLHFIRKILE